MLPMDGHIDRLNCSHGTFQVVDLDCTVQGSGVKGMHLMFLLMGLALDCVSAWLAGAKPNLLHQVLCRGCSLAW